MSRPNHSKSKHNYFWGLIKIEEEFDGTPATNLLKYLNKGKYFLILVLVISLFAVYYSPASNDASFPKNTNQACEDLKKVINNIQKSKNEYTSKHKAILERINQKIELDLKEKLKKEAIGIKYNKIEPLDNLIINSSWALQKDCSEENNSLKNEYIDNLNAKFNNILNKNIDE